MVSGSRRRSRIIIGVLIALAILAVVSKLTEGWWAGLWERRAKPPMLHRVSTGVRGSALDAISSRPALVA